MFPLIPLQISLHISDFLCEVRPSDILQRGSRITKCYNDSFSYQLCWSCIPAVSASAPKWVRWIL